MLRRNPPLAIFGNPPRGRRGAVGTMSTEVIEVRYIHAEDGKPYKHQFGPDVCMEALEDGSVRIYGKHGQRMWGDF